MKNLIFLFVFFLPLFALIACGDDEDCCVLIGVAGTWVIEAEYYDPGDGSGDFTAVTSGKSITLRTDGTFVTANGGLCANQGDITDTGTYTDTRILPDNCVTIGGTPFTYDVRDGKLLINYPCTEPCVERYVRE